MYMSHNEIIELVIEQGVKEVLTTEPVYGGERILTARYTLGEASVLETITYRNSADAQGWAAIDTVSYQLEDEDINVIEL
jgi:hypothetical protein